MRVLLHTDSAYFTTYFHRLLKKEDLDILGYWYNPQIHPFSEYRKRLLMMKMYAVLEDLPMIYTEGYPIEEYLPGQAKEIKKPAICQFCFKHVLSKTAAYAKELKMDYFSTSWCADPGINQKLLKKVGDEIGSEHGVRFYYQSVFKEENKVNEASDELKIYHQKWCGCLYSEKEVNFQKV